MQVKINAIKSDLLHTICIIIEDDNIRCSFEIDTHQFGGSKYSSDVELEMIRRDRLKTLLLIIMTGFQDDELKLMLYFNDKRSQCDTINIYNDSTDNVYNDPMDMDIAIENFKLKSKVDNSVWNNNTTYTFLCNSDAASILLTVFDRNIYFSN